MNFKTLATASAALMMLSGAALAQTAGGAAGANSNGSGNNLPFASDDERMMYEQNMDMMGGFFTDDTMATLRPEDEVKSTFEAMDADSQAGMKTACERAMENRGSYGTVTTTLCSQIGVM